MALVALTNEQRVAIKNNTRFQNLVRMGVYNQANYWKGQDGANLAAAAAKRWAKSRYLSVGIMANPTAIDFVGYLEQYIIAMKTMAVFENSAAYNEGTVIDYMIANNKFDELSDIVFDVRIERIEF